MIYFLRRADGAIKIGTTIDYHMRLSQLIAEHGDLELLGVMKGSYEMEHWLHQQFDETRINSYREWFEPSDKLLDFIRSKASPEVPKKRHLATVKMHPTIRAAIDYVIASNTVQMGRSMSTDEALWHVFKLGAPDAVQKVLEMGAQAPTNNRYRKQGKRK